MKILTITHLAINFNSFANDNLVIQNFLIKIMITLFDLFFNHYMYLILILIISLNRFDLNIRYQSLDNNALSMKELLFLYSSNQN